MLHTTGMKGIERNNYKFSPNVNQNMLIPSLDQDLDLVPKRYEEMRECYAFTLAAVPSSRFFVTYIMADKDQVIQALRATLISVKGALTIKQCNRDYRELQGEWIPFKKLGYPTLEKLFQDVPGFKMSQINGEWYVDAIASQETQHIASMVARQKSTKKTNVKLSSNRFPKKQGSWRKPASSSSYPSSYDKDYSKQFYRYKSNTSLYNNTKFQSNKYNKVIETKNPQPQQIKLPIKVAEQQEKVAPNVPKSYSAAPRDTHIDKLNHSKRNEKESEPRGRKVSASQRLTNLRDRLSTVDLIPLQLPAHNNYVEPLNAKENMDPVTQVVPAHNLEPPPESTSSQEKLEWTCRKLGLPQPVYNLYDYRPKKGPVTYDCTVKVGSTYSVSSYPDSSPSEQLARELAAGKVLAMVEGSEVQGLPTAGAARALQALADLVADHEAGLWASIVPHMYREKYNENLPNNWQELVENCPRILKDRVVNGLLVLLPNNKTQEPQEPQTPQSPLHCAPAGEEPIDSDLPPLQFPDQDFWNVFITVANSTLEVWLRIIGIEYSNMFDAMLIEMAKYYEHYGTSVDKSMIIKNAWYAVNLSDGGWQRAKLLDLEKDTATVFLGDHGDDDTVNITNVKILEPQFRKLPAQAILCRLEGAEELAASEAGAALVARRLPGEVLVAAPGPRADPTDPAVAVVLYDTSTQRDLNLNKEIVHDFCIAGAFTVTQKLTEMEVGCVTDEGRVWVSRAGGAALVRNALALLTSGPYRRPLPAAPHAPPPHPALFIVRTLAGDWVRCVIISELDGEGTVRTQLVDSGLVLRAPLSSLVPLHSFSPALNAYPYQAIQVRLGSAERVAASMATRLRELLVGASVLCRAAPAQHATHPNPCPDVELYVRSGPNHLLGSVNDSILIEYEYLKNAKTEDEGKSATDHVEALNKKKERIFRTASGGALGGAGAGAGAVRHVLPPPVLPAPGKCFDVYIAMAANPWNFIVQSNTNRYTLQTMMMELQRECPKLSPEDAPTGPAIGELFTAYYPKDSSWYRVTIAGTVTTTTVSIYFCDFGDLALFAMKDLRPVPASVPLARSLPPQAIKGKLFDVCPLYKDWTVEDCIRFQELCVEQQFVGICKEVDKDPLNPKEPLLILDLIDTSTDEDIYLNKQLVAEGRARLVSNS